MIFFYHPSAGEKKIILQEEFFRYLILSRRHRVGEKISVRNLEDKNLYEYEISKIEKKKANLELQKIVEAIINRPEKNIHLAWGICDIKTITKTLPFLNELGVTKISFLWCERSQKIGKNFTFPIEKLKKILISSCEQCGRIDIMDMDIVASAGEFLKKFPETKILDFGGNNFNSCRDKLPFFSLPVSTFLIGPEGGFSENERKIFDSENIISFDTPFVLRSETAIVKVASMI